MTNTAVDMSEYMEDAKGRLVPRELVKDIDIARDDIVKEMVEKVKDLQKLISEFKIESMGDVGAFVELSAEKYGASLGGLKGNVTLSSYDGKYKIKLVLAETMSFDERLQAAKNLVDECINEWSEGSKAELKVLVNDAFQVDKEGNISTGRILNLRRHKIEDERWIQAMDAISESLHVVDIKPYIRFYEKDSYGKMVNIPLDIAAL